MLYCIWIVTLLLLNKVSPADIPTARGITVVTWPTPNTWAGTFIRVLGYFFVCHPVILQKDTLPALRFCRQSSDICAFLGFYIAENGNSIPTFRDNLSFKGLFDPWSWDRCVVPKRRYGITVLCCVKLRKSADLI